MRCTTARGSFCGNREATVDDDEDDEPSHVLSDRSLLLLLVGGASDTCNEPGERRVASVAQLRLPTGVRAA